MSFLADVPAAALHQLLALLADDPEALRRAGGPAKVWAERGHHAIAIEQIDYAKLFADRDAERPARKKDDLWRAIVRAVLDRRKSLDDAMQRRLLDISGDVGAIGELSHDVMTPHHSADGSPMLTTQAAAVIAAYRHLASIVEVMAPERRAEVIENLAAATTTMDPRIVIEMLRGSDEPPAAAGGHPVRQELAGAFDDLKAANLLANTLAVEGQASPRLAEVFATIAPDESRRRRVLTLARELLSERSFGQTEAFLSGWGSMEELLLTYNERPFVGTEYKVGLDSVGARAEHMAREVAPELAELVHTLDQENVRRLSVILLIDLLRLERDPKRAPEVARDVGALAEDLLLAGDYAAALDVTAALAEQAGNPAAVTVQGCRTALDSLAATLAFREATELFGEMEAPAAVQFTQSCRHIGPAAVDGLRELFRAAEENDGDATRPSAHCRVRGARSHPPGATRSSEPWFVQRNVADLLGHLRAPEAVPLLQPLLRGTDPRVMGAAVQALSNIDDPAAARAIHTVLRAATGDHRMAVVSALGEGKGSARGAGARPHPRRERPARRRSSDRAGDARSDRRGRRGSGHPAGQRGDAPPQLARPEKAARDQAGVGDGPAADRHSGRPPRPERRGRQRRSAAEEARPGGIVGVCHAWLIPATKTWSDALPPPPAPRHSTPPPIRCSAAASTLSPSSARPPISPPTRSSSASWETTWW